MSLHGSDLRLNRTSFPRSRGDEPSLDYGAEILW